MHCQQPLCTRPCTGTTQGTLQQHPAHSPGASTCSDMLCVLPTPLQVRQVGAQDAAGAHAETGQQGGAGSAA
jgi:hypothetical protein